MNTGNDKRNEGVEVVGNYLTNDLRLASGARGGG